MKDKANKGYWQRLAKIYAPLMESDKKFYNAICGYIRDYLKSDMNVLELACGTGQLSFPLSDCTNSWTATDFSENMIKQAKRRGTTEKLSFCVADATALSYENENFDCVVISNALHIMPEPEKAMQEIRRVLKKDGILYAPTFLWAEKKSSGLRKRLMSITGFKAYKEWNKENFCEFITDYGFTVVKVNLVDVHWYEADLPEVIEARKKVFGQRKNETLIAGDMFKLEWVKEIDNSLPTLLIVSGVFQYFHEEEIIAFIKGCGKAFPKGEMLFDATSESGLKFTNWFIKRTGNASAIMYFGINDSKEFANKCSMELLEEKTFFPEALKMLGKKLSFVTKVSMKVAEKKKQVIILRLKLN